MNDNIEPDAQDARVNAALNACRAAAREFALAGFQTQPEAVMAGFVAQDAEGVFSIHGSQPATDYGLAWAKVQAVEELRADVWRQALATGEPPEGLIDALVQRHGPLLTPEESEPEYDAFAENRVWQGATEETRDQKLRVVFMGGTGIARMERIAGAPEHALRKPFDVTPDQLEDVFEPTDEFDA